MQGKNLYSVLVSDESVRRSGLFGSHGGPVNLITEQGKVYMRAPDENHPLYAFSLDFTQMRGFVDKESLTKLEMLPPLTFTKGMPLLKFPAGIWKPPSGVYPETMVFDLKIDPKQKNPFRDPVMEASLMTELQKLFEESDVPEPVYRRYGLVRPTSK